ncbi:MAG TPA: hypothetical protein VD701_05235 [Steroidobacteraceae bacterium]|nr:hypothetical protein [Steroidobacteraceae bacterium]
MGAVEHITLDGEADPGASPPVQSQLATLHRYTIPGRLEGHYTELSVLESHYLRVRIVGSRSGARVYQLDLRFADPAPVRVRRVPWTWALCAGGLAASGLGILALTWPAMTSTLSWGTVTVLSVALVGAVIACVCLRWTTESLELRSVHGAAALVGVTGRLGSMRSHQKVFAEVSRNIVAAGNARPQDLPQFLRDEMREHFRLRKLGVLSATDYEAAKAAILAAH